MTITPRDATLLAAGVAPPVAPAGLSADVTMTIAPRDSAPPISSAPPSDPTWSLRYARYEDIALIAQGGMGEVRRVREGELGRTVAMKVLSWDLTASPRERARFLAEMRTTAALQHPGIVPVHDAGMLPDGRLWFTMKEVRGVTLRQVIADLHDGAPAWSLRRVIEAFARVGEAVAYAHGHGVIHRDIKPDNIMVGELGEVLVMDWGLAKHLGAPLSGDSAAPSRRLDVPTDAKSENATRAGDVMGTLGYMAPEQARGENDRVGPASDVYALGAVLYEILAGHAPYRGSGRAVWLALLAGPPEPILGLGAALFAIPVELAAICERAMARAPRDRFDDASSLAAAIRGWLDGAHKLDRALLALSRAHEMRPALDALRARSAALSSDARRILGGLSSFAPLAEKSRGWALQDEAARLEREASVLEVTWIQAVQSSLDEVADLRDAHQALADHYRERLDAAEEAREAGAAAGFEALLRAHDRGRHATFLSGEGALSLITDPDGAEVSLDRYVERDRVLVAEPVGELGRTPLRAVRLPRGSYLVRVRAPGRAEVRYPVFLGRGEHWDGTAPGEQQPRRIPLPRPDEVEANAVYLPAGWFLSGGDPAAADSLPRRRLWAEGLVVQRDPVTNAEYLAYLNDLLAQGREAEALAACPRAALGRSRSGEDTLAFARDERGAFLLTAESPPADELRWPVAFVSWRGAVGYARWFGARTGRSWRLLGELEWEKAARGVDGRLVPWGDFVDPSFACMLGSHPGALSRAPIDAYSFDASPYGVRGLGGNVRDWCLDIWTPTGPAVLADAVLVTPPPDADASLRVARGGTWTTAPTFCRSAARFAAGPAERFGGVGFRLARPV